MKASLKCIFTIAIVAIFALASDVWSQNDDSTSLRPLAEISEDKVEEAMKPVYHKFENPEEALAFMEESENKDQYFRGILPQMAKDVLSYAEKLLNNQHEGFLVVDKDRMKVIKYNKFGEEEHVFGMACARNYGTKHKKADSRTPEGFFSVKQIQNSTSWHYVDDYGNVSPKTGEFGPRFIRLRIPNTNQIGIHGTSAPGSIGGRRSHGCIRLTNENILKLVQMVDTGMPVIISPGKRDIAVNKAEGYFIPKVNTLLPDSLRAKEK